MAYVIGIDTGGTYTDAVLLDVRQDGARRVKRKAKALTTHQALAEGIRGSIQALELSSSEIRQIEKVVLSTTLATNAIVEGTLGNVGVILIGGEPAGKIAARHVKTIDGKVNIKGRVLREIDREEAENAVQELLGRVTSFAVSGPASVRNPALEQKVKAIINRMCDLPVICGHELVSELGFLERTNTAVINGGLLPVINRFIKAIGKVLEEQGIAAPVFVVKGDGSIAKLDAVERTPIDTVLSGPAASMIGTITLTGLENAVVADMGGTTTDTGLVYNRRVELSPDGAIVGGWKIQIKSAKLFTFGLGGDSAVKMHGGEVEIGPERVLPACRGGEAVTPTDILHKTGEFVKWDRNRAAAAIGRKAAGEEITPDEYVRLVKNAVARKIERNVLKQAATNLPICAIGAPAETWYNIAKAQYAFHLVIPKHYEVANAVGAAAAGIQEVASAIVRQGEDRHGYLVYTKNERYALMDQETAILKAIDVTKEAAIKAITDQNLELEDIAVEGEHIYNHNGNLKCLPLQIENDGTLNIEPEEDCIYLETRIKVMTRGKIFADQ